MGKWKSIFRLRPFLKGYKYLLALGIIGMFISIIGSFFAILSMFAIKANLAIVVLALSPIFFNISKINCDSLR